MSCSQCHSDGSFSISSAVKRAPWTPHHHVRERRHDPQGSRTLRRASAHRQPVPRTGAPQPLVVPGPRNCSGPKQAHDQPVAPVFANPLTPPLPELAEAAGTCTGEPSPPPHRSFRLDGGESLTRSMETAGSLCPCVSSVAALVASLIVVASADAHEFAVRGDQKIGAYAVNTDGSVGGAARAFGEPSSRRRSFGKQACSVTWQKHGLTIDFYNLDLGDACEPEGRFALGRSCVVSIG